MNRARPQITAPLFATLLFPSILLACNKEGFSSIGRQKETELRTLFTQAATGSSAEWGKAAVASEQKAREIQAHPTGPTATGARKLLEDADGIVRGMAALTLIEGGIVNTQVLNELAHLPSEPRFQNQRWDNTVASAAVDARIRAINAIVASKSESPEAVQALRSLLEGQPSDKAVFFALLEAGHVLQSGKGTPALVQAIRLCQTPIPSQLPDSKRHALMHARREEKEVGNVLLGQRLPTSTEMRERTFNSLKEACAKIKGCLGAVMVGDRPFALFEDSNAMRASRFGDDRAMDLSDADIDWQVNRLTGAIAGNAGYQIDKKTKRITLFQDRTMKWLDWPSELGPWKVEIQYLSQPEVQARRRR